MTLEEKKNEILVKSGLDFRIEKLPMVALKPIFDANGNVINHENVPTKDFGLYNDKTGEIINVVKGSYTVSQNDEIVESVLKGSESFGELSFHQGFSIHGGRKVILQLKIEGTSKVGKDTIHKFITVIDSNDGSSSLNVGLGDFTVSCQNQFYRFPVESKVKGRHTRSIGDKIQQIEFMVAQQLEESMQLIEIYNKFQSTKATQDMAHALVNAILGFDRTMKKDELEEMSTIRKNQMDSLYKNIGLEMQSKGMNGWGLFSGITRWTTHDRTAPVRTNGRVESLVTGSSYKVNQKGFDFVSELVL